MAAALGPADDADTRVSRLCPASVLGYVFDLPASIASSDGQTDRGWLGVTPSELCLLLVRHSTATARLGGFDMSRYWGCESSQYSPVWCFVEIENSLGTLYEVA